MVILRFKIRSKPEQDRRAMGAPARDHHSGAENEGVVNFDIARTRATRIRSSATAIYEERCRPRTFEIEAPGRRTSLIRADPTGWGASPQFARRTRDHTSA